MKKSLLLAAVAVALGAAAPSFAQPVPIWTHDGGFASIAADAGGVYATKRGIPYVPPEDYGYGQVYPVATVKLDADGAEVWYREHPGFDPGHDIWNTPGDIAVAPSGDVVHFFTEQCVNGFHSNGVLLRYGAAGDLTSAASYYVGRFNNPFGVAVDAAGDAYVSVMYWVGDFMGPYTPRAGIAKYDAAGAPVLGPGSLPYYNLPTFELPPEFATPYRPFDVAAGSTQDVFVTGDPGTLKYDGATFTLLWWSPFAAAQVVAAGDGGAYVTGPNGTARLGADGQTLWVAAGPGVQLVAASGGAIVTDGATTVQYAADGAVAWTMAAGGSDLAQDGGAFVYLLAGGAISKYPVDQDGDGFVVTLDCNDLEAAIHPGATEVKRDGVDQDCNGYDLTIETTKAQWASRADLLRVEATSALGEAAALTVSGYGPMSWVALDAKWVLNVKPAGGDPGSVVVQGVEGADFPAPVVVR